MKKRRKFCPISAAIAVLVTAIVALCYVQAKSHNQVMSAIRMEHIQQAEPTR